MTDQVKETIYQVAEDVLEKLAFLFSFREEEREPMDYESAVVASVSFTGQFEGRLLMAVSAEVLPELAANMLGIEEETSREEQQDALKELINVICGNLLPELAGRKKLFNVNAPQILTTGDLNTAFPDGTPSATAKLSLEEGQCDLVLYLEENASLEPERPES
jgi:CheY-specific phosphatase CheX